MKRILHIITTILLSITIAEAQVVEGIPEGATESQRIGGDGHIHEHDTSTVIPHKIVNWKLSELGARIDSLPLDTMPTGFQVHNPADREAIANVQLGNTGAPWQAAEVSQLRLRSGFLFTDNLSNFFREPDEWRFYNTKTPYTNLYYHYSGPKRRSEEVVAAMFTQNINADWNVGFDYRLISSIGKYEAQEVNNRHFRFFSSYIGENYSIHGSYVYNKADQFESGGLTDDDYVLNPEIYDEDQPENYPVNFYSATNRTDNHQLYLTQSLDIGHINIEKNDSLNKELPVAKATHSFHLNRNRRVHRIDDLSNYYNIGSMEEFFYNNIYADSTQTRDSVYYTSAKNSLQLKFNEEANALLNFGLRAYITNEIEKFTFPIPPAKTGTQTEPPHYLNSDSTKVTTSIGGEIYNTTAEALNWNAGMNVYIQGYRAGDSELRGGFNTTFRIKNDTTNFFADGGLYLNSPSLWQNRYWSNHIKWDENFSQTKTLRVSGGLDIPTRRLKLTGESRFINDHIYWDENAKPTQTGAYLKLLELRLQKYFQLGNFHSRNTIMYQASSHQDILPLPEWVLNTSNYYEGMLFDVLFYQLGFDLKFTSKWYAPAYLPATGQFHIQKEREVGEYPYVDLFLNMHLKRARIFIKVDHINEGVTNNDYFHSPGYPVNPRTIRFGLSWNFYD
ncbi:putative porin [Marinilabiliaceae bacterium ANBcel2]|nr:putative porin [Marinilabiliaceae bacterium ANBcel2]